MTDKDKMQFNHILSAWHNLTTVSNADDAIAEVALFMWQAAKESDRKELEAAHAENMEQARLLGMGGERELKLTAEKEALEKKLAEEKADHKFTVDTYRNFIEPRHKEELTQREASARQQGFEEGRKSATAELEAIDGLDIQKLIELGWTPCVCDICGSTLASFKAIPKLTDALNEEFVKGKQAGRDELQKELSEQEPVKEVRTKYHNLCYVAENELLIRRPLPPQVKGE